jgi:hypothetical protein
MSEASVLAEAQHYLLNAGDPDAMVNLYADVRREVGLALPIWTQVRTLLNLWSFLALSESAVATDQTASAQGAGTPLSTTTALSGHLIGGTGQFETVVYTVTTAHVGGTPVYEYTYWNGLTWLPCTLLSTPAFGVLGAQTFQMVLPADWVAHTPPDVTFPTGFSPARYWLRVRATTAPSTTPASASVVVHQHTFPLRLEEHQILTMAAYPTELSAVTIAPALDLAVPDWQTQRGTPRMYCQSDTPALGVRIVPLPASQGVENGVLGLAAGVGAAVTNNLVLCAAITPQNDTIAPWLEGILTVHLASREAERLGESTAAELATALRQVGQGLINMLMLSLTEEVRDMSYAG